MTKLPDSVPWTCRNLRATVRGGAAGGVVATLTMDAAMLAAGTCNPRAFASDRLTPQVIGRWAAGLLHGRCRHEDITLEAPVRGELALGIATHYATGIVLTGAYLLVAGRIAHPLPNAIAYGLATSALPLFVLFPSLGYGWAGTRSGEAARLARAMLAGHLAFGAGIGLYAARSGRGR